MAAPTIRQVLGDTSTGEASVTTTAQTAVDDLLIVIHQTVWRDADDLVEPTGTTGIDSWVSFETESTGNDADAHMRCWRARVTSGGAKFIELDPPGSNNTNSMIVLVLTGVDHANPIDGTTSSDGNGGTSFAVGGITTTSPDSLLVGSWAAYGSGIGNDGFSPPGSMTFREENSNSTNNAHMCATQALSSAGATGSRTATLTSSAIGWAAVLFAVRAGAQTIIPTSIPTAESWGTPTVSQPSTQTITPTSIPTAEAWGTPLVAIATPQTITFPGEGAIVSGESWGEPTITITVDPRTQRPAARPQVTYELVCVARIPQSAGPPVLLTVEGITWSDLDWTDELSQPQTLEVHALIKALPEPVVQRLNTLAQHATELWLYRNGRLVFAGPLIGWRVDGDDEVRLTCRGLLFYTRFMAITADLTYTSTDQFTIAKNLIDHWQNQSYGHYGILTDDVGTSGVTRTVEYKRDELHSIAARLDDLAEGAFDIEVDPATRRLQLWAPRKGIDRSSGPDAIVFDDRNVTDSNMLSSCAPGDIASEAYGVGTTTGTSDKIYATASNDQLRATFGRTAYTQSFDETTEAGVLGDKLEDALAVRDSALLVPGPDVRNVPDADLADYAEGDTVDYQLHERLGIRGAFRIRRRRVQVNDSGQELISLEFE